jgi:hypothetical protein
MGEAFLTRKGGASFRRLVVIRNPDKMEYYAGQYPDLTGAIIGAQFGTSVVPLHPDAVEVVQREVTEENPNITVTAMIGRKTRTLDIPVEYLNFSYTLDENDWERIAKAAELGIANQLWHIGDVKNQVIGGESYQLKIIGFNHDDLSESDEQYSNAEYNGGTKKAAIAFQFFNPLGKALYDTRYGWHYWPDWQIRTQTLAADMNRLPDNMRSAIRLVKKYTQKTKVTREIQTSDDRLFLASTREIYKNALFDVGDEENAACSIYEFYQIDGNKYPAEDLSPLRSIHYQCNLSDTHIFASMSNGSIGSIENQKSYTYFPIFCV